MRKKDFYSEYIEVKGEVPQKDHIMTWDKIVIKEKGDSIIDLKNIKSIVMKVEAGDIVTLGVESYKKVNRKMPLNRHNPLPDEKWPTEWKYFPVRKVNIRAMNGYFADRSELPTAKAVGFQLQRE